MTKPKEISAAEEPAVIDEAKLNELGAFIDGLKTTKGALIEILHKAQEIFGWLPREVQLFTARNLGIPGAEVYGAVSFYSYFSTTPPGKHTISVCMGTACFVRGSDKIIAGIKDKLKIESNETTPDGLFTLKDVRCIGACGLAPIVTVDGKVFGRVKEDEIDSILQQYQNN